jgi:hypothetical protein
LKETLGQSESCLSNEASTVGFEVGVCKANAAESDPEGSGGDEQNRGESGFESQATGATEPYGSGADQRKKALDAPLDQALVEELDADERQAGLGRDRAQVIERWGVFINLAGCAQGHATLRVVRVGFLKGREPDKQEQSKQHRSDQNHAFSLSLTKRPLVL